jgi:hypothetical protein
VSEAERLEPGPPTFLGEQRGAAEEGLKAQLVPVLERFQVRRAYLLRVKYGSNPAVSVALCLDASDAMELVSAISDVFSSTFNRAQALDILFLSSQQVASLAPLTQPFFVSRAP